MSDKSLKDLRKQLRAIVREELPAILTAELVAASHRDVTVKLEARLDAIVKHLTDVTTKIDQRSKDVQSYLLRNTTHISAPIEPPKQS